ncbi:cupin domain-containing protein [Clostridium ljungdahlii]|uniref:Cupin domain protein n=1 Tax=Clostridium ljungdahlii TaxID=1538 RepID=A0A168PX43_9CLOT|nr:cupin domain-containing protein [Clostridium ljungdahlii]OAA88377.1 Cupin domain protein [Clostridium ljungdahlii]
MYNNYRKYPCDDCINTQMYNAYPCPLYDPNYLRQFNDPYIPFDDEIEDDSRFESSQLSRSNGSIQLKDYGPQPFVVNINKAAKQNNTFRTALWTGKHLQVTLMSINVGDDIGLEIHPNVDQFIRIEEGQGLVKMGKSKYNLNFQKKVYDDFAIMIPAGTWHNVINTGNKALKVYSIYAPPQHPRNTVHVTKADAQAAERD